ncbi:hypothetical protein Asulf_00833 [Archaeoglobus sulfaticallidus PM70-1]|uniref:Uncharacterized protein n=1 Tax=Archaeoglobus sulfaticallidus PM70-1 TaxID=387631 RepID=N0BEZ1_9EURY|nr:hypothetical protein [Archaeoglobus sulfaticallidus]AGK60842.1 hypothetical protein Asulf_00833 [Archaeoglobus sulfaticallidus PM70-1]
MKRNVDRVELKKMVERTLPNVRWFDSRYNKILSTLIEDFNYVIKKTAEGSDRYEEFAEIRSPRIDSLCGKYLSSLSSLLPRQRRSSGVDLIPSGLDVSTKENIVKVYGVNVEIFERKSGMCFQLLLKSLDVRKQQ